MNNTINSSTPVEIRFYSKTIHRWVGTDINGTQKVVPYQEEEKLEEAFSLWLSYEELMMCMKSREKYKEIIVADVINNWPTISSLDFQENVEYRFIECNKEIIRASANLLLYRYHVCDRTRFRPASLSLIDSLKKTRIKSDTHENCCDLFRRFTSGFQTAGSQQWSGSEQGSRSVQGCGSRTSSGTPSPSPQSSSPSISRLCLRDSSTEPNAPSSAHASDSSEDDDPDDVRYDHYHRIIISPEGNELSVPGRTSITVKFVKIWSTNAVGDSDSFSTARRVKKRPSWVLPHIWVDLEKYWTTDKFKKQSEQRKKARASEKGGSLHCLGSRSMGDTRRHLEKKLGRKMSHDEFFMETHIRKKKAPTDPTR
ncbi:uncharacterized protein [Nicotiana sylvestris]|uniref:uncharacterized protein n=1 Tax=Nicotiana sylvestris TaxID=4096 RepID=UPI00388C55E7